MALAGNHLESVHKSHAAVYMGSMHLCSATDLKNTGVLVPFLASRLPADGNNLLGRL